MTSWKTDFYVTWTYNSCSSAWDTTARIPLAVILPRHSQSHAVHLIRFPVWPCGYHYIKRLFFSLSAKIQSPALWLMVVIILSPFTSSMQHILWFYAEAANPLKEKSMNLSSSVPENIVKGEYLLMLTYSSSFTGTKAIRAKAQVWSLFHSIQEEVTMRRGWIRSCFSWIYPSLCKTITEERRALYS